MEESKKRSVKMGILLVKSGMLTSRVCYPYSSISVLTDSDFQVCKEEMSVLQSNISRHLHHLNVSRLRIS
jgi:hypothetical protein